MKSKLLLLLIPAILGSSTAGISAQNESTVRILFTNNSNGKLENCHCRNDHTGGLTERVDFLRKYRKEHSDILLLDSGGYLGLYDVERKGPAVLELMTMMKYDAWSIGDQELYWGFGNFMARFGGFEDRMVNASLVDSAGRPVFGQYRIFTVGDIRIGVTGIVSKETFRFFPDESHDFAFESPDTALERVLPEMKESCDYIIVLSQMGKNADVSLAERQQDIDLIIGGHSQTLLKKAIGISGCHIVQAGKGGGRVGEIIVTFDGKGDTKDFAYKLIELDESYKIPDDTKPILEKSKP